MVSGVGALGIGWRNLENSRGFICGGSLGVRLFFFFLVSVSCLPGGLCFRDACFSFPGGLCLRDVIFLLLLTSQAGDILYVRGVSLGRFLSFFREVFASLVCFS
jgi:hypothetical protein